MQHSAFNYMLRRAKFLLRPCGFRVASVCLGRSCAFPGARQPPTFVPPKKILDHLEFPLMNGNMLSKVVTSSYFETELLPLKSKRQQNR